MPKVTVSINRNGNKDYHTRTPRIKHEDQRCNNYHGDYGVVTDVVSTLRLQRVRCKRGYSPYVGKAVLIVHRQDWRAAQRIARGFGPWMMRFTEGRGTNG